MNRLNSSDNQPLLVFQLKGTQRQMGRQHGELLLEQGGYEGTLDYYQTLPQSLLLSALPLERTKPVASAALGSVFEMMLRRLERDRPLPYRQRTRAFFEALGRDPDESRFLQVMDVFQNAVNFLGPLTTGKVSHRNLAALAQPACSTLSVWGHASADGQIRHARNFDFPGSGIWDEAPALVFCSPDKGLRYGFVTTRGADMPSVTCFNEAGLAFTFHTRFHRQASFGGRNVIDLGHQMMSEATTLDEAVSVAKSAPTSSTWGIAISSAKERRAIAIETTAKQVAVVEPKANEEFLTVANRYHDPQIKKGELNLTPTWPVHSAAREKRMRRLAETGFASADALEHLLHDHHDDEDPQIPRVAGSIISTAITVKSVVVEPESARIRLSTATAPTGWGPFADIDWAWEDSPGVQAVPHCAQGDAAPPKTLDEKFVRGEKPHPEAYAHYLAAVRCQYANGPAREVLAHLEAATKLATEDPSMLALVGLQCLYCSEAESGAAYLTRALTHEHGSFRRGQLMLWTSRAQAALGNKAEAKRLREDLLALSDSRLADYQQLALKEQAKPLSSRQLKHKVVNLVMVDC